MHLNRLSSLSARTFASVALGIALFGSACSGGDATNPVIAAAEQAQQAADSAAETASSDATEPEIQTEVDRYGDLEQASTHVAEIAVGDGRLMLGVQCLEGYAKPTALLIVVGDSLPVGSHDSNVSPPVGSPPDLRVFEEAVQDLPAGSTYSASQTGFDEPEYTVTYESLDTTFTVPGC